MTIFTLFVLSAIVASAYAACPSDQWIEYGGTSKCFYYDAKTKVSYKEAIKTCEAKDATLVSVCSFFENQFVRGITRGADTWLEPKTECDYRHYLPGQEPTPMKSCRIVTEDWDGQWSAADCDTEKHHVICEIKVARDQPAALRFIF